MLIWTLTTAFNGVYQPLLWLENMSGSPMEKYLVWMLLVLSVAGMARNVSLKYVLVPAAGEKAQSAFVSPFRVSRDFGFFRSTSVEI